MKSERFSNPNQTLGETTIDDAFGYWLSGITDGDGTLMTLDKKTSQGTYPVFRILLRSDDREVLRSIARKLGVGSVTNQSAHKHKKSPYVSKPTSYFQVAKVKECPQIVKVFEKYPLRSKKRHEFEIWKQIVALVQVRGQSSSPQVKQLARELKEAKRYNPKITDTGDGKVETSKVNGTQNP